MYPRITYKDLNSRQQENYNFHKAAAILADYGFNCIRLSDDWQGADFIALHVDGRTTLRVQMKGRPVIAQKYMGKDLYVGFLRGGDLFLCPHDELVKRVLASAEMTVGSTPAWLQEGEYSWSHVPKKLASLVEEWRIPAERSAGGEQ